MIFLFTGVPGAGKTLNAIKFVNEDAQFKDRPIFYYNIRELNLEWHQLSGPGDSESDLPNVMNWYELPHGSVVVIDECQAVFPPRNVRQEAPKHVAELNTHRHLGIDIVLITQHPRLIDTSVKPLVGQHQHYERKYGWTRVKRLIFEKCCDNTDSKAHRELSQIKQINFDKKYYGVYKSAEVHTHKKRVPVKLVAMLLFMAFVPGYLFFASDHIKDKSLGTGEQDASAQSSPQPSGSGSSPAVGQRVPKHKTADDVAKLPLDREEYLKLFTPRIEHMPHTAPIYDELVQPQEAPKTLCTSWRSKSGTDNCRCFTQQMTQVKMSFHACKAIVDHRMWDPTYRSVTYTSSGSIVDG